MHCFQFFWGHQYVHLMLFPNMIYFDLFCIFALALFVVLFHLINFDHLSLSNLKAAVLQQEQRKSQSSLDIHLFHQRTGSLLWLTYQPTSSPSCRSVDDCVVSLENCLKNRTWGCKDHFVCFYPLTILTSAKSVIVLGFQLQFWHCLRSRYIPRKVFQT